MNVSEDSFTLRVELSEVINSLLRAVTLPSILFPSLSAVFVRVIVMTASFISSLLPISTLLMLISERFVTEMPVELTETTLESEF